MSGIQIPNSELVVCSRLCIIYFFHSFPLNHSLLYWHSRYLFKISKHDALPNPVWPFHSYCCISQPDPTNLPHDSTEQTTSKKLFTHRGFLFVCLVSFVVHQPYGIFLGAGAAIPAVQVSSVQWERQDEIPGAVTELSLNGSTRGDWCWADVWLTITPEEVRKRWFAVGKTTSCHA